MVSVTCVRVPVLRAQLRVDQPDTGAPSGCRRGQNPVAAYRPAWSSVDDRKGNQFPEPIHATGQDDVLVGRLRADAGQPAGMGMELFASGDQLRVGAATNAMAIWEVLKKRASEGTRARGHIGT